jgi:hypothetical protein
MSRSIGYFPFRCRSDTLGATTSYLSQELRGTPVSVATVNKELRHLKAALRKAKEWGYLPAVPTFHLLKEPRKLPLFVTPEHFTAIYPAGDVATAPVGDQPKQKKPRNGTT